MQDYNTIVGVIQMRLNKCSYSVVQDRYHIGSGTVTRIMNRFKASELTLEQLRKMEPSEVETLFYPPEIRRAKDIPLPDFQMYFDRIHSAGSKVNLAYCWIDYKQTHPNGYEQSQFYELFNQFVQNTYGGSSAKMAVERRPGEKLYIDWVGDHPALLLNPNTGELKDVHVFVTTLGLSSLIYAELFLNEKLPAFVAGTVHALQYYGGIPKYLVPDNLKAAVKKHSRDELVLQTAYSDLEDFYDVIVLPPPPRKPKGKATVENGVRYLETHLLEKLRERTYTSLEEMNVEAMRIVEALNSRVVKGKGVSRKTVFEKYDKPCLKPLPGGKYTVCEYKTVLRVPDNYHIEFDGHYYSVLYTHCGKPAIVKASMYEVRICDQYNRIICTHKRVYSDFPRYITEPSHMRPEHLYYKEVNEKDGAYYRRWAAVFGPSTAEFIDRMLKSAKHEEQAYNSCAGILHAVKDLPHGLVEEAASQCIRMNSCRYKSFKQVLSRLKDSPAAASPGTLPEHANIRGRDNYK